MRTKIYYYGISIIGRFFHFFSYFILKKRFNNNESGFVLMGGPSSDLYCTSEEYDVAIASNLTDPIAFIKKVKSGSYFHCFSDPSILSVRAKREMFNEIVNYSKKDDRYVVLIPVQYIKDLSILKLAFQRRVFIYNQNSLWRQRASFHLSKYSYPNMSTILLDCALPWLVFNRVEKIDVIGFDADYGVESHKKYSSANISYEEELGENTRDGWSKLVVKNANLYIELLSLVSDTKIRFDPNSGYGKNLKC